MSRIIKALLKTIVAILIIVLTSFGFYIIPWIMIGIWSVLGIISLFISFFLEEDNK